jgi:hypothetical protein
MEDMMKYIVVNATPIRLRMNGIDKSYKVGEIIEANESDPQIIRALAAVMILPYKPKQR